MAFSLSTNKFRLLPLAEHSQKDIQRVALNHENRTHQSHVELNINTIHSSSVPFETSTLTQYHAEATKHAPESNALPPPLRVVRDIIAACVCANLWRCQ